ncbi:histidine kinase dimerization/phosphoacceptor domain -containing protein [Pedobacter aquatilis]|uniref:histidine kinase dimerization/phosphoacceptor domain -containing protein n=1 Tax=Pedobacter aquatilis TaxID=351343 RepID=UPI0025B536EB|nr:histidine kinase dimerization/phosphoacceptor domain -containing protein [Pedobacter aquatilis]MDN3588670.1 histidine kinase dimerization/phosphoacceptor domain -containing protein [Pedobacter aquatilis]
MKIFNLLMLFIFSSITVAAQNSRLEELSISQLKLKLARQNTDTTAINLKIALGRVLLLKPGSGSAEIDSAIRLCADAGATSSRIGYRRGFINSILLNALALNKRNEPDAGLSLAREALAYSTKVQDLTGIAESYIVIGQHYSISKPEELIIRMNYYRKASSIFRKTRNLYRLASSLQGDAEMLLLNRQHMEAIKILFEAINVNKTIGNKSIQGIYWLIGRTLNELGDLPSALKYSLLALKHAKMVKDTTLTVASINFTTSSVYTYMKDYKQAIPYAMKALEIARHYNDSDYIFTISVSAAFNYSRVNKLQESLKLLRNIWPLAKNDADSLHIMTYFLGSLNHAKKYKQAALYADEVTRLLKKLPPDNFNNRITAYNFLASYYIDTRQIKRAYEYAEAYEAVVRSFNFPIGVRSVENMYFKLDSLQGNYQSAIKHHLLAQGIKDSIDNVTKAYQVSLLQIENDTEKKNNDIDTLTKAGQLKDAALKRTKLIQKGIISGAVLLAIITALIFSRYQLKQRTNQKLEENQRELDQKNSYLERLNTEHEKLLKEKEWLIKEVHHRVKNNLQMVTSLLSSQTTYLDNDAAILAVNDSLRRMQAMSMIHQKLYQDDNVSTIFMPEYIDELIHYLRDSFDDKHRIIFNQNIESLNLDVTQAIPLGLILTESIVNSIKYAFLNSKAGIVDISLGQDGTDHLLLFIADNGSGLPEGIDKSPLNSLGLDLMQGLARQLKGTFEIKNNNGVQIKIRFLHPKKTI